MNMKLENNLTILYILAIIFVGVITVYTITNTPKQNKLISSEKIVDLKKSNLIGLLGKVVHKTCSGRHLKTYERCINIRQEGQFLSWNTIDQTDDTCKISILRSGIIEVRIKSEK